MEQMGSCGHRVPVPTAALPLGSCPSLLPKQPRPFLLWKCGVHAALLGYKGKPESLLGTTILGHRGVIRPGLNLMDTWFK